MFIEIVCTGCAYMTSIHMFCLFNYVFIYFCVRINKNLLFRVDRCIFFSFFYFGQSHLGCFLLLCYVFILNLPNYILPPIL